MFRFKFVTDSPFPLNSEICTGILSAIAELPEIATNSALKCQGVLNVAFVDDAIMQMYNREYRQIDATTDVLSFHYFENFSDCGKDDTAGEILLSESKIRTQSQEYNHSTEIETYKLLLHSVLHILGYDHETDQDYAQMKILEDAAARVIERDFGIRIE